MGSLRYAQKSWRTQLKRGRFSQVIAWQGRYQTRGPYRPLKYTEVNQWTHWDGTGLSHAEKCGWLVVAKATGS